MDAIAALRIGEPVAEGRFQLDVKRALTKLGLHLFAGPEDAVAKLVQFGVRHRTAAIRLNARSRDFTVTFLGLELTESITTYRNY